MAHLTHEKGKNFPNISPPPDVKFGAQKFYLCTSQVVPHLQEKFLCSHLPHWWRYEGLNFFSFPLFFTTPVCVIPPKFHKLLALDLRYNPWKCGECSVHSFFARPKNTGWADGRSRRSRFPLKRSLYTLLDTPRTPTHVLFYISMENAQMYTKLSGNVYQETSIPPV